MRRLQIGTPCSATILRCRLYSSVRRSPAAKPAPGRAIRPAIKPALEYKPGRTRPPKDPTRTPPPRKAETVLDHWRSSWLPLTGAAVAAGLLGFYIFGTVAASFRAAPCQCDHGHGPGTEHSIPTGRPPALTGDNAEQFDRELNTSEWLMGITSLRRRIAGRAEGRVLEVAMGSGRNLEYYNWEPLESAVTTIDGDKETIFSPKTATRGVTSFTGVDISPDMLDVARRRLARVVPPVANFPATARSPSTASDNNNMGGLLSYLDGHLRLVTADAHTPLPLPSTPSTHPPVGSAPTTPQATTRYDTIIQTFGLCSVADPVAVLTNLASVLEPETGRIILLEHGKGWFGLVNGLLDRNAGRHFDKYGCWWNRDIQALAEEATRRTPGLEIVTIERPSFLQMGTLVWVELRLNRDRQVK